MAVNFGRYSKCPRNDFSNEIPFMQFNIKNPYYLFLGTLCTIYGRTWGVSNENTTELSDEFYKQNNRICIKLYKGIKKGSTVW